MEGEKPRSKKGPKIAVLLLALGAAVLMHRRTLFN